MSHKHYVISEESPDSARLDIPRLLYTGVVCDDPEWFNIMHVHPFCEILFVSKGSGSIEIGELNETISAGDIVVVEPAIRHSEKSSSDDPFELLFFAFDNFKAPGLQVNHILRDGERPIIESGAYRLQFEHYFSQLVAETRTEALFSESIAESLANVIILLITRMAAANAPCSVDLSFECRQLKEYLDEHYMNDVTLESLSSSIFVSKFHLSREFKKEVGISPIKYVISKRVNEASRLLLETNLPIKDIAIQVGYPNSAYFSQTFKRVTGKTPSEFRLDASKI